MQLPAVNLSKEVTKIDCELSVDGAISHDSTSRVGEVGRSGSGMEIWDHALDRGPAGSTHETGAQQMVTTPLAANM